MIDYTDGLKRPLAETDASGNITRYYVWNGAQLLCHIKPFPGGQFITRYYHADELGSTLALTDESGAVTDQFAYMPYGYATHTGTTETPYQWLGGYGVYYDSTSDLHLTLHRAYSCKMKRFISPDPLGIDGGVNVYMWANLNPLAFVDPYGLCAVENSLYDNVKSTISDAWNGVSRAVYGAALNQGFNMLDKAVNYVADNPLVAHETVSLLSGVFDEDGVNFSSSGGNGVLGYHADINVNKFGLRPTFGLGWGIDASFVATRNLLGAGNMSGWHLTATASGGNGAYGGLAEWKINAETTSTSLNAGLGINKGASVTLDYTPQVYVPWNAFNRITPSVSIFGEINE